MLTTYIALDGRNFGAGVLHWIVARDQAERRQVIAAIGPLWSWHEVWLVGTGGVMAMAFPQLMAASFSGCYLVLFLILWCVLLRGGRRWIPTTSFVIACSLLESADFF